MAVVAGTVQTAFGFTVPRGDTTTATASSAEYGVMGCYVNVTFPSGTYSQTDEASIAPATVIAATRRNGRTPTILDCAFAGLGEENGAIVGAKCGTITTGTVAVTLLKEDLTTERDAGAMSATWGKPMCFYVTFKELD